MAKSYFEEFYKKYNRPHMNDITVGFSGIDPSPKSEISETTEEIVREVVQSFCFDGGEITIDDDIG